MDKLAISKQYLAAGNELSGEMEHQLQVAAETLEMCPDSGWEDYNELDALRDAASRAEEWKPEERKMWAQAKEALVAIGDAVEVTQEQMDDTMVMTMSSQSGRTSNAGKYWFKHKKKYYVYQGQE